MTLAPRLTWAMVVQAFERARLELGHEPPADTVLVWADDEHDLDRPINYDPDAPGIADYPTIETEQPHQALTIDELLGPEVAELIRANKLPEQRGGRRKTP